MKVINCTLFVANWLALMGRFDGGSLLGSTWLLYFFCVRVIIFLELNGG